MSGLCGAAGTRVIFYYPTLRGYLNSKNHRVCPYNICSTKTCTFSFYNRLYLCSSIEFVSMCWWVACVGPAVMSVYLGARRVHGNSDSFEVEVGMRQGSALAPLLFVIVLETIVREFRDALPWELLYAARAAAGIRVPVGYPGNLLLPTGYPNSKKSPRMSLQILVN